MKGCPQLTSKPNKLIKHGVKREGRPRPGRHQRNWQRNRSRPGRSGSKVCLNYFDWEEKLEGMEKDFSDPGGQHLIVQTNLLEVDKIPQLIRQIVDRFGRLDILINNIERGGWPVVHGAYVPQQWDLEMQTTLRAKRWVFECALPLRKPPAMGWSLIFPRLPPSSVAVALPA